MVDRESRRVVGRFSTGAEQPGGLAVTSDGRVLVAHPFAGQLSLHNSVSGDMLARLDLRGEPTGVAISVGGRRAFVSLAQLDQVVVLDLPELREVQRISVGRRPRALALTPDGETLLAANFQEGSVSRIAVATLRETGRVQLTGVNLRGLAVAPDGRRAFVTGQIPANARVTRDPLDMWTNTVFVFDARADGQARSAEGWIDFAASPAPDPDGIVALGSEEVAVTLGGSDELIRVRTPGPHLRTYDPVIEKRLAVGLRPRGLARSLDGRELWVADELGNTLSVVDANTFRLLAEIDLGTPALRRPDSRLAGRYLFGSAQLARGGQFSCSSCHPDGKADGLTWEFAHVPDRLARRNTRSLRGGITRTGPFRWSGVERDIEEFFQDEIVGLLQGPRQAHPPLHALWMMLDQFPLPRNPYRTRSGQHSAEAQRGRVLFHGKAGCIECHAGEMWGGAGVRAWVGTTPPAVPLDVPHLHGAFDSAPYLHDGRALSLEDVFNRHNSAHGHGRAHLLSPTERAAVLRFVREL